MRLLNKVLDFLFSQILVQIFRIFPDIINILFGGVIKILGNVDTEQSLGKRRNHGHKH